MLCGNYIVPKVWVWPFLFTQLYGNNFQMTVTSDYRGFAGVQTPATHPPPPSILSSELKFLAHGYILMRARSIGADDFLR